MCRPQASAEKEGPFRVLLATGESIGRLPLSASKPLFWPRISHIRH
jgi:hypothetical protein